MTSFFLKPSIFHKMNRLAVLIFAGWMMPMEASAELQHPEGSELYEISDSIEGNYLAAYVAGLRRDMRASSIYYQQLLLEKPKDEDLKNRAFVTSLADGDLDNVFEIAKSIYRTDKKNSLAQFALIVQDMKKRHFKAARKTLRPALNPPKRDLAAILLTAWAFAGSKDRAAAERTLNYIADATPLTLIRNFHMGLIKGLFGDKGGAVKYLEMAYRADTSALKFADAYARALSVQGNTKRAIEVYKRFDRQIPNHPIVTDALKRLEAGETLKPLINSVDEGTVEVLYAMSAVGRQPGGELSSILYLQLALYLEPDDAMSVMTLADVFQRVKQYDETIKVLSNLPDDSPVRPYADVETGYALSNADKKDEALAFLRKRAEIRPDDVDLLSALGDILRNQENWAEAIEVYSKAVDLVGIPESKNWILFFSRGTAYERNKQWPEAEADLQKALDLMPQGQSFGRAQVLNYLGYSWVDRNKNIDSAFKMLQEAISLAPRDAAIIDSLGWAYYRLKRYDEAVRELERAIELKPSDPVLNDHLGDAYWRVGRENEARFQWQHSLDAKPEPEAENLIKRKLEIGLDAALAENKNAEDETISEKP